jgi:hypothetical protein
MKLENIKDQKIYLLGKSRSFDTDEFFYQLHENGIIIEKNYNDTCKLIVEGRLMTPYEQNEFDAFYEMGLKERFCTIDELEKVLIENIDEDVLLMSLKLSHDKERLLSYIKNSQINNQLFLKLIALYDWQNEGFFENDQNRDVSASLISRFYENIERNHNVQYATLGLMHLVEQSRDPALIEAIANLEPLKKGEADASLYPIFVSLAKNSACVDGVLKVLLKKDILELKSIIASREGLSQNLQNLLYNLHDEKVCRLLSENRELSHGLVEKLKENHADSIAKNILLDEEMFRGFADTHLLFLASNSSLTPSMQKEVLNLGDKEVLRALCANISLERSIAQQIWEMEDGDLQDVLLGVQPLCEEYFYEVSSNKRFHLSLAKNANTPVKILEQLSKESDFELLKALCQNSATPISILYELRLDRRLERIVAENENFTNHIKSENIGWLD